MAKDYRKAFYELVNVIGQEQAWNKEDMKDPQSGLLEEGFDLACERMLERADKILKEV